jgi:hypothetical protein
MLFNPLDLLNVVLSFVSFFFLIHITEVEESQDQQTNLTPAQARMRKSQVVKKKLFDDTIRRFIQFLCYICCSKNMRRISSNFSILFSMQHYPGNLSM